MAAAQSLFSTAIRRMAAPAVWYNTQLNRHPLFVKSVTSGAMYGLGDVSAQVAENYTQNKARPADDKQPLRLNWRRIGVFFVFGTIVGGPAFHYWFGYLDLFPIAFARLNNHRQRQQILQAFAVLKKHGFEVKMDTNKLPDVKPFNKWVEKAIKIALDQLVFSSIYLGVFFLGVGCMMGGVDKVLADSRAHGIDDVEALLSKQRAAVARRAEGLEKELLALRGGSAGGTGGKGGGAGGDSDPAAVESIDRVLELLREEKAKAASITWTHIWDHTLEHTKAVYVPTYIADCVVWPPLQLINFTFVPLQYRVLYVNVANLFWNTFLSLQANKSH